MQSVLLSEVVQESRSGFWGGDPGLGGLDVRVVRNGDIQDDGVRWSALPFRSVSPSEAERASLRKDDVLITTSGDCGYTAYIQSDPDEPTIASNFVRILRFDLARVIPRFLYHFLHSQSFRASLAPYIRGTALKNLSFATAAERINVPLPSRQEQWRIAELLDKADALRTRRRAALAQLDTLTQAIFLDLFGDPATNPKRWVQKCVGRIGTVTTGNTPPRDNLGNYGDAIEWIKSDNLNTGGYYATRASEGLSEAGIACARIAPAGAILVTCIAGSPGSIGNAAMVDRPVAFNQQINALVPDAGNPHFYFAQLAVGKRLVQEASTGGMKGLVSKGRFEKILLMEPPPDLQDRFSELALRVEAMTSAHHGSLARMDALFTALQDRAFQGEL